MATATEGKEEEIARLLSEGIQTAELVRRGYARGTVYKVAGRLKEGGTPPQEQTDDNVDAGVEDDPGIVDLKKELRKAELERQIEEIKGSSSTEIRLKSLEAKLEAMEVALEEVAIGLQGLDDRLDVTPLLGIRERFVCSCGSQGMVAVKVICTSCDRETSYGWWPKRDV